MDLEEVNLDNLDNCEDVTSQPGEQEYFDDDIKDDDLIYQIPKYSKVILYHGDSLDDNDWMRKRNKDISLDYYSSASALKEPYKYMSSKILEANDTINDYLDEFIYDIKSKCNEICHRQDIKDEGLLSLIKDLASEDTLLSRFNIKTAVETYYVGRIRYEFKNGRFNYRNVYLEASVSACHGDVIPLDLSLFMSSENTPNDNEKVDINSFSLFPGQIVIVKAQNLNGNYLHVTKFIDLFEIFSNNFPPKAPSIFTDKEPVNIVCACGPFVSFDPSKEIDLTDASYMKAIADYLKHYNPDVLFFFGPFFDEAHADIVANWTLKETLTPNSTFPYHWTLERMFVYPFRYLFKQLEGCSVHTRIVVIPSANELGNVNIFPTSPADITMLGNVVSFSNPSLLKLGGIAIGATSADILLHLSRKEIYSNTPTSDGTKKPERLKRLAGHVLAQQNFYPLLPPDHSVNVEYTMYNHLKMLATPHLLFLPSILKPFIYNINGTIVINPGKVSKNSIARIMVDPSKNEGDYSGSLSQYINVEIIKLVKGA